MKRIFLIAALIAALVGCTKKQDPNSSATKYPEPRFPSYLKKPKSVDEILPYARALARTKSGYEGKGMGVVNKGETVLLIPSVSAEPMVLEAIVRALKERGIQVLVKFDPALSFSQRAREGAQAVPVWSKHAKPCHHHPIRSCHD